MKVIIDENIPYIHGVLEPWMDVEYAEGGRISRKNLDGVDALLIRTRTKCNSDLLEGTGVKFIGTATIGTDHIDLKFCSDHGIECASAPGCNSGSVMQYLASSLVYLSDKFDIDPAGTILGIVGAGNVGSKVAMMAETLGFNVLLNDPPRERLEGKEGFSPINTILYESDIISIHVPLSFEGPDKTYQLINDSFISRMNKHAILINTSRGQVVDEKSLMAKNGKLTVMGAVIDVWRNEPEINTELLAAADIGTAHIAGYSADGKANGTRIIVRRLAEYFNLPLKDWIPDNLPVPGDTLIDISESTGSEFEVMAQAIKRTYSIEDDSRLLKDKPEDFEKLRNNYAPRREFHAYKVHGKNNQVINKLRKIGFR